MRALKFLLLLAVLALGGITGYVYAFPEKAAAGAIDAERNRSGLERKEIQIPSGETYVYLEGGDPKGAPLVLLHGFGANKDNFTRIARLLGKYHVIIPDHIGFGESSHPQEASYSPPAQVERLHAFIQALNLGKVHVGGSSMGGGIAASWGAIHPEDVQSLWLLDAAGAWSAPKSELQTILEAGGKNPLMATNEDEFATIFAFVMAKPPFIPRPILDVFAQERIKNNLLEQRIFTEIRTDQTETRITGMTIPTLIVFGEKDRAINVGAGEVFHKILPNSELIVMKDIGHLPMLENVEQTAKDYLAFREKLGS